jgi:cytochrome P450
MTQLTALRTRLAPAKLSSLALSLHQHLDTFCRHYAPLQAESGTLEHFRDFVQRATFAASVRSLFGDAIADTPQLFEQFLVFDQYFELASSDLPHFLLPRFTRARAFLLRALAEGSRSWPDEATGAPAAHSPEVMVGRVVRGARSPVDGAPWLLGTFWASQANTMVSLFWYLIDLCAHPDFLQKARAQAEAAVAQHGGQYTKAAVSEMTLLDAALKESVRLRAAPIILRATLRPVTFGPYEVPPGHFLCLSPLMSHRRHDMFEQPHSWVPERWLAPHDPLKDLHRYAYISFGSSLYRCPGQHYAYLQLVLIAAYLLINFDWEMRGPIPEAQLDCLVGVQKPAGDLPMAFRRRIPTIAPH